MQEQIYFLNCEEELQTERVLNYLNYERRPLVHFTQVDDIKTAKYVLLTIGRKCMDNISAAAECQAMLCGKAHIIILVRQDIFESYEKYCRSPQAEETSESYAYQMIQVFNESKDKRKWIYTYSSVEEIVNIVGNIILAEYFEIDFVKPIVTMKPNEYFQNTLIFRNEGYVELTGYYIDGFFIHNVGKHRPKLRNFNPVMKKADPFEELHINMDFKAPDIAGSFIFYIIVKKMGRILKMEDSIRSFTIHVRSFNESGLYDAVLLEEHPGNGKLYTQKDDFKKIWRLKNVSGEDWKKVVFKVRYEHLTHYFCKERKKVLGPIPNGSEFTLDAMFHPPDIPGKYTAFWQLLRADGTEIIIDGPLCCSVVTQYETQSLFEVCFP